MAGALIHTGSGARVSRPTGDESPRAANAILRSAKDTDALVSTLASLAVCLLPSLAPEASIVKKEGCEQGEAIDKNI